MPRFFGSFLLLGLLTLQAVSKPPAVVKALKGLDPVELSRGKEVQGKSDLTVAMGLYLYQFASTETKAVFEKEPTRYAIQMGGACARMGPLSGMGHPERYAVHDGRIYIFASDACRKTFLADPTKFLPRLDPIAKGDEAATKRGKELVDKAVEALGGAAVLDSVTQVVLKVSTPYEEKGKTHNYDQIWELNLPTGYRRIDRWEGGQAAATLSAERVYREEKDRDWNLNEEERNYLRREFLRHPVALLRSRGVTGFVAVVNGKHKIGETEVELVDVSLDGATTTLGIDPATGKILLARYPGYGMKGIGTVEKFYSDFKAVEGLTLPHAFLTYFNGKPQDEKPDIYSSITVTRKSK